MEKKEPKVRVEHLVKRFDDLLVLDDLSFNVEEGEFLCNNKIIKIKINKIIFNN